MAGVTQDPVPVGRSVTYAFVASAAGTYWYHSHHRAATQVDRGLYGALVVDPAVDADPPAVDQTLVYSEWPLALEQDAPPAASDPAWIAYVSYSVNGKTGPAISPVGMRQGQRVRLRLVNAGYMTHYVHLDGALVTIEAFDGHGASGGPATADVVPLGAGERLDLGFEAPARPLWLRLEDPSPPAAEASVALLPPGMQAGKAANTRDPLLDIFTYPALAAVSIWPAGAVPTRTFVLELGEGAMRSGMPGMSALDGSMYEINGQAFPNTRTLDVDQGDLVEITFVNRTRVEHAMHVHGHVFQVLARDGVRAPGAIAKDTVVVWPGTSVTIGFIADNPGWWMLHCHQLEHARAGLMALLRYRGRPRPAELGGPLASSPD